MPLLKSKSKESFSKNVETEMNAGKPQKQALAIAYAMKRKAKKMAMGGMAEDSRLQSDAHEEDMVGDAHSGSAEEMASGYQSEPSAAEKANMAADMEDARKLNQHGEDEVGPEGARMAEGGEAHEEDMVGRIMKQRAKMYSKGGRVANEDHGHNDEGLADFSPNEFDDLALRDDLESSNSGANAGDELGNAQEDSDRKDMVSRIMASRRKKDRLPNPR